MTAVLVVGIVLVFITLLRFPVVGPATLPAAALLVVVAAVGIVATRGPRALPERTTSPDEPSELGTDREK